MIVEVDLVLLDGALMQQVGEHYDIQKNCTDTHVVTQNCNKEYSKLCPVEASTNRVVLAMVYGVKNNKDPLCVFQIVNGNVPYLTVHGIISYY